MMPQERRHSIRKTPENLAYISLPFNNGGIVLDVSEGGLGFRAIAPVKADGPIRFQFAIDAAARVEAVGELAWKDETGKTGGLRFTMLPDEMREYIRVWSGQAKSSVLDIPLVQSAIEDDFALSSKIEWAPFLDLPAVEQVAVPSVEQTAASEIGQAFAQAIEVENAPVIKTELAPVEYLPVDDTAIEAEIAPIIPADLARVEVLPAVDPAIEVEAEREIQAVLERIGVLPFEEPAIEVETAPSVQAELALVAESQPPLLYNLTPPVYSAPFYDLSMFPLEWDASAAATSTALPQPSIATHPIAAILLTAALSILATLGIMTYLSVTHLGEALIYYGEQMWSESHSQPVPRVAAPQTSSAMDSSNRTHE
jgi:hypothetical protein